MSLYAQSRQVSGTVLDEQQLPIIGAAVMLTGGGNVGAVTDVDGNFVLSVPSGDVTLEVTCLGYESKTVAVTKSQSTIVAAPADEDIDFDAAVDTVKNIFGIAAFSKAAVAEKDFEGAVKEVLGKQDFKVSKNKAVSGDNTTFTISIADKSLSKAKLDAISAKLKENFKKKAHSFAKETNIVQAKLKEPGIIGACLMAKNK